ncbi:AurF N-oxygenase family protein [Mycolicibacterium brumae]|uniref:Diiron oxygenase n=1 Tax=Mycolicibacterium brumae TaxID=85968 RepID=A0A2G5PAP0_9MYCO|nr:diiron oxygenase [Mycolicibacterium brumae]MCV7192125.1 diiron oxygenase [Mycolicibacterium brumae]PIB75415.1 diiron oxygenase [Mycolicibacterium brumae]RWA20790.1 membrane protein [Mycolicibacterium brumae DSM 44177]UWW07888.1 diiron oxygenase [Mycolicibacterium brumae]
MSSVAATTTTARNPQYAATLAMLSEGSVRRHFDPYADIDWDAPDMQMDPGDPRWVLSPTLDTLGGTEWYRNQPLERQIEIGRWRTLNSVKVGAAFESILIRGLMAFIMKLPNNSPEFRYALHEMTEECNHIQMFQELVNRSGTDVPGMRPLFRKLSPYIGLVGHYSPTAFMAGILAGEEPIDHFQKGVIREGANVPPAVLRTMQIHIAEEARHISWANEFLKTHMAKRSRGFKLFATFAFPLTLRWLATEIMTPPKSMARELGIPRKVWKEAFWRGPHARKVMAGYFPEMRALSHELGIMTPLGRRMWKLARISGEEARYRGEPDREAIAIA